MALLLTNPMGFQPLPVLKEIKNATNGTANWNKCAFEGWDRAIGPGKFNFTVSVSRQRTYTFLWKSPSGYFMQCLFKAD